MSCRGCKSAIRPGWSGSALFTVAARDVNVWLYSSTGDSVLAATLFHAVINVSCSAFPGNGSSYDPVFLAAIMVFVAVAVTAVPTGWARQPMWQRGP
ncbi:hypothetical protein FHX42_003508 [Saccharopolyspora lacisalsi]|uniref:CPBP family intramembrane metalloprotease n=1 Tax=Halosaccharopolyspora lacisalsi TaxID=1000566 RepID=A0A839DVZ1_9PSEU|nr:hypothetical protein [Halosaccharopolyspora lacisalsi]MBA8826132.1 hypothetical protein [Halosaccharopolyspora lacisalsi]